MGYCSDSFLKRSGSCLLPWDSCSPAEQVGQEAAASDSWKMPSDSWLAASHSRSGADLWGWQELGDFLTSEARICLQEKEGLLGQSNPHQMLRSTGAKRLHETGKEDFVRLRLPEVGKDLPREAQSFKVFPLSLEDTAGSSHSPGCSRAQQLLPSSFKALPGGRQGHACLILAA